MGLFSRLFGTSSVQPEPAKVGAQGMEVRIVQGNAPNVAIFERSKARVARLEAQLKRHVAKGRSDADIAATREAIKRHKLQMEMAAMNMRADQ